MTEPTRTVCASGDIVYYLNGKYHRENGPAYININGSKWWFYHGNMHREDGPALEWDDGAKIWYLFDQPLSEEQYDKIILKMPSTSI